ncbi:hypothetical protein SODALDRAFT_4728 [Sodiomyces alkalinus F11]|uniref:BZIP domain-containing protein n=1 Tax=Sodiomyces alkalinus (strain CBS 110278 / VKM F-3762 / F11) TaxID=1314773 RepID=A0A3N2Q5D5_SODAK|nr:hypothetical protein SODALDRAFT_4728 [Sodiomyces alkalinus F11]ROT41983.1 hypothetical protein SODALDRAFT_4728 [Sodiomyces alkalinus F11]
MTSPGMILKWSSKPKDHNTIRVRENQRRHRARRKAYIEDLERQLDEARAQLSDALAANAELQSEMVDLRTLCATRRPFLCAGCQGLGRTLEMDSEESEDSEPHTAEYKLGSTSSTGGSEDIPGPEERFSTPVSKSSPSESASSPVVPGPPPSPRAPKSTRSSQSPGGGPSPKNSSSSHESHLPFNRDRVAGGERERLSLPLADENASTDIFFEAAFRFPQQAPGESTIPCIVADAIISDQSCNRLDLRALSDRLGPGFRGATVPEEGCRIVSTSVFSVLDTINPL